MSGRTWSGVARGFWVAVAVGCSASGYAEPGPSSPHAYPPPPDSVREGSGNLQPGLPEHQSPVPPAVNAGGAVVPQRDPPPATQTANVACSADTDCVPATCCHPTSCAPVARQPSCAGVGCSTECRPGTLDCGQARCVCLGGRCAVQGR